MTGPLAGVRVLDLTHFVAGPWCTMLLADLGAEVTKLEPPAGEIGRGMGSVYSSGESAIFLGFNRGKRSISLDLKQPEGLAAALQLVEQSDVVVQNFRPGTAERLGLGAAEMRAKYPKLIYCTVSAFGPDGPYATLPANDPVIQALSGSMASTGQIEGRPVRMGVSLPDVGAGVLAAVGILAAVYRRAGSGTGSTIDLNLLDTQLYAQTDQVGNAGSTELGPGSIRGPYVCGDGLSLWVDTDAESWIDAGLQSEASSGSEVNRGQVAAILRTQPRAHWLELLGPKGTSAVPVLGLSDVLPGAPSRTLEVQHPAIGTLRQVRTPVEADPPWPLVDTPPPRLGEHTREVLHQLGFPNSDIDRLLAQGAVREPSYHPTASAHPTNTKETHVKEQS
ncbi:CaiB/BaiF CoA transferase family protein [Arthrobacter sp. NPDC057013]|uniref:CaiB/BaiF CoA transferase family protein n=1 Tax=Arthrobacter sp. NPDC057013 TaxID=3345999 RepID=UPI003638BC8B